jgi:membrane protein DedA with SNARE-associated domain
LNSIGAIIVAAFAVLWVAAGASNMQRRWFTLSTVIAFAISGAIVFAATRIPFGRHSGGFNGKIYGIVVMLEFLAILIAAALLNRSGRTEYLIPVIALIVGLHFFGMVPATRANEFWWVGGAMCVLSLLTMSILPQPVWSPVVGFGCALILWLSALGAFF